MDQREPLKLQSRQENLLSTSLSRDFTKQPGNENLQSSSLPRKVSAKDTVECPICMEYFPSENIENHASTCYGPVERVTTRSQNESEERLEHLCFCSMLIMSILFFTKKMILKPS